MEPPVDAVYSSPFYRCLQTIAPCVQELRKKRKGRWRKSYRNGEEYVGGKDREEEEDKELKVRVENGIG